MFSPLCIALVMAALPDAVDIPTLEAGDEAVIVMRDGEGWFRILEDDYVCLKLESSPAVEMRAYDDEGSRVCTADPGKPLVLSAFTGYWFYIKLKALSDYGNEPVTVFLDTVLPGELDPGAGVRGKLAGNVMAETYTFTPAGDGRWTFVLEGKDDTDLGLDVYGTDMNLWNSGMSREGREAVTVPVLAGETVTLVVNRYGKTGSGVYRLMVESSGAFPALGPTGGSGSIGLSRVHRYMIPPSGVVTFVDLVVPDTRADLDLVVRDGGGGYLASGRSYTSPETLMLEPCDGNRVVEVLPYDIGDGEEAAYTLRLREAGDVWRAAHAGRTLRVGDGSLRPVGFSPPRDGLYVVSVAFEKKRDGDVRVFRNQGEAAVTFADPRGEEAFLLYVSAGDTVWIDPFYSSSEISGEAGLELSPPGAVATGDFHSGRIDTEHPVAFHRITAEPGTILDISLSGKNGKVDLDLFVSGPGVDLMAAGYMNSFDAAGDETVEVYSGDEAEYGITVYLYDRKGATDYELEVNRIRETRLAGPSPDGEIWAMAVGISGYPSSADVLNRAGMDAVEFYDFLVEDQGVPADHVVLMVDGMSTTERFLSVMRRLLERAGPEDRVVIFFSGHGKRSHPGSGGSEEEDSANEYICLYDGDVSDDRVAAAVDSLAEAPVFLFIDACHSGGFVDDFGPGDGVMILTAAGEDLEVSERVLTPILLRGSGGDADFDGDGYVSAIELMNYVDRRLRDFCPECGTEAGEGVGICPSCGAVLEGNGAVPGPEQGMFLDGDILLWKVNQRGEGIR